MLTPEEPGRWLLGRQSSLKDSWALPVLPKLHGHHDASDAPPGPPAKAAAPTGPLQRTSREGEQIQATANYLFTAPISRVARLLAEPGEEAQERRCPLQTRPGSPSLYPLFKTEPLSPLPPGLQRPTDSATGPQHPGSGSGTGAERSTPGAGLTSAGARLRSPGGSGGSASARHGPAKDRDSVCWGSPGLSPPGGAAASFPRPACWETYLHRPPPTPHLPSSLPSPGAGSRGGSSLPRAPPQAHPEPAPAAPPTSRLLTPGELPLTPGIPWPGAAVQPLCRSPLTAPLSGGGRNSSHQRSSLQSAAQGGGGTEGGKGGAAPASDPEAGRVAGIAARLPGGPSVCKSNKFLGSGHDGHVV